MIDYFGQMFNNEQFILFVKLIKIETYQRKFKRKGNFICGKHLLQGLKGLKYKRRKKNHIYKSNWHSYCNR